MILAIASIALATTGADIAGTWNATVTWEASGTCATPQQKGATNSYQWLVSTTPDGTFSIAVQGETNYPRFSGRINPDGSLVAVAYAAASQDAGGTWLAPSTTMTLDLKDGSLSGLRIVQQWGPVAGMFPSNPLLLAQSPCFEIGTVVAKR